MDILEPNHITTEGISFFSFNTKNEAQNFSEFLNTQFIIFLRRIKQYDRSFTSMIFSYIPFLDFNINWTDDKLYNYFKISDDEIKIINEI
jgi:hypothetical protein